MMRQPMLSFEKYQDEHLAFELDLILHNLEGWSEGALPRKIRERMHARKAGAGYAINMHSRIVHACCTALRLDELIRRNPELQFFAIDLLSVDHVMPRPFASAFQLKEVKKWVRKQLPGVSFIGGIDAAYYYNGELTGQKQRPIISWHAHIIAWGSTETEVRELQKKLNSKELNAFHYRKLKRQHVVGCAMYAMKAPMSEYCIYPSRDDDQMTSQTRAGVHIAEEDNELRPGTRAEIAKLLNDRTMNEVLIAGGTGKRLRRAIFIDAWWLHSGARRRHYRSELGKRGLRPLSKKFGPFAWPVARGIARARGLDESSAKEKFR